MQRFTSEDLPGILNRHPISNQTQAAFSSKTSINSFVKRGKMLKLSEEPDSLLVNHPLSIPSRMNPGFSLAKRSFTKFEVSNPKTNLGFQGFKRVQPWNCHITPERRLLALPPKGFRQISHSSLKTKQWSTAQFKNQEIRNRLSRRGSHFRSPQRSLFSSPDPALVSLPCTTSKVSIHSQANLLISSPQSPEDPLNSYQRAFQPPKRNIQPQLSISNSRATKSDPNFEEQRVFKKSQISLTLVHNLKFFVPFSRSSVIFHNHQSLHQQDAFFLKTWNLRRFCNTMFLFEQPSSPPFNLLNSLETRILEQIFKEKNYYQDSEIPFDIRVLGHRKDWINIWKIFRAKRKEENIKYGFRILSQGLFAHFKEFVLDAHFTDQVESKQNQETLFYLSYFGEQEFGVGFKDSFRLFFQNKDFRKRAGTKLRKYFFPVVNRQNPFAKAKTLNKRFFKLLSCSRPFVDLLNKSLILFLMALGDVDNFSQHQLMFRLQPVKNSRIEVRLMNFCLKSNEKELTKMFSEWKNLTSVADSREQNKGTKTGSQKSEACQTEKWLSLISKNIGKLNFKCPWALGEIRNAFLESFLWINEHVHPSLVISELRGTPFTFFLNFMQNQFFN